jgi:hypothetical protein
MREVIIEVTVQVIGAIVMGVIGIMFAYIGKLIGQNKKLENISSAMNQLEGVVQSVVGELQQTMVEGLKEASVDGKLSNEDIYDLGRLLVQKATEQLSDPASATLEAAGIDIVSMIHSMAEAYIERVKRGNEIFAVEAP